MNPHRGSDFNEFLIEQGFTNTDQPMRPTPRTDAAEIVQTFANQPDLRTSRVPIDFARQLERELSAAKDGWTDEICKAQADMRRAEKDINEMRSAYLAERALADRLRKSAQALVDRWETPFWKDAPHTAKFIRSLDDALAAWKEARRDP